MYKVIASTGLATAYVQKENGNVYASWGPEMIRTTIKEEDLIPIRAYELENRTRYSIHFDPPIEIEKLEDWPAAVQGRLEQMKVTYGSS